MIECPYALACCAESDTASLLVYATLRDVARRWTGGQERAVLPIPGHDCLFAQHGPQHVFLRGGGKTGGCTQPQARIDWRHYCFFVVFVVSRHDWSPPQVVSMSARTHKPHSQNGPNEEAK